MHSIVKLTPDKWDLLLVINDFLFLLTCDPLTNNSSPSLNHLTTQVTPQDIMILIDTLGYLLIHDGKLIIINKNIAKQSFTRIKATS